MRVSLFRHLPVIALFVAVMVPVTFAKNSSDITQFGHDVRISSGQAAGEITCLGCSVYVQGQVGGDITTIGGNVVVEDGGMIGGAVTAVVGDVRVADGSKIGGDLSVVGGVLHRQPTAMIGGDVTELRGRGWVYLLLLSPFLVFFGIIALIVWLVQRRRRTAPVMARAA
jgi:hypothetical protein